MIPARAPCKFFVDFSEVGLLRARAGFSHREDALPDPLKAPQLLEPWIKKEIDPKWNVYRKCRLESELTPETEEGFACILYFIYTVASTVTTSNTPQSATVLFSYPSSQSASRLTPLSLLSPFLFVSSPCSSRFVSAARWSLQVVLFACF